MTGMEPLLVEQRGTVRWLLLNRPERRNALDITLIEALDKQITSAESDPGHRGHRRGRPGTELLCRRGLPPSWSCTSGATTRSTSWSTCRPAFSRIAASPKPWVAVVHGSRCRRGLELALACDVVVAADTSLIGDGHLNRRLVPAGRIKRPVSRCGRTRTSEAMILWLMTMVMTRRLGRRRRRTGPAPARVPIPARRAA